MMSSFIVILVTAYLIVFGWLVMWGLDRFLRGWKRRRPAVQAVHALQTILLYGADKSCLPPALWETCDAVDTPNFPAGGEYRLVLAVSDSDLNNLMLCAAARRAVQSVQMIARCNDSVDRAVFHDHHVDVTVSDAAELQALLSNWGRI